MQPGVPHGHDPQLGVCWPMDAFQRVAWCADPLVINFVIAFAFGMAITVMVYMTWFTSGAPPIAPPPPPRVTLAGAVNSPHKPMQAARTTASAPSLFCSAVRRPPGMHVPGIGSWV